MMATGRRPKTAGLGLEGAGVALSRDGAVKVDDYSRTTAAGVWAIGDVTNRVNLTVRREGGVCVCMCVCWWGESECVC